MKISMLGVGNMLGAILEGILKSNKFKENDFTIFNRSEKKIEKFRRYGVNFAKDEKELAENAEVLIIGVKPYDLRELVISIKEFIPKETIIVSILANTGIKKLEEMFGERKIIRVMPNTPVAISRGMNAIARNGFVEDAEYEKIINLFEAVGTVAEVAEKNFDAFSAIAGCMPAYVYMFIEASADAAVKNGIKRDKAYEYIARAVEGSAAMVAETGKHPAALKDEVTSPSGSTIRGVMALEENGFRNAIIKAIDKSANMD